MVQTERAVSLDKVQIVLVIQDGKGKGTFQPLRHIPERVHANLTAPGQELNRDIAVCLNLGGRKLLLLSQEPVVADHAVMGQGKASCTSRGQKWVVIVVLFLAALGGQAGVPHHYSGIIGNLEREYVAGNRTLAHHQGPVVTVCNSGGVLPSGFTGRSQCVENVIFLLAGKVLSRVNESE